MFTGSAVPTPDGEWRVGRYELTEKMVRAPGVPLTDLIGAHVADLEPTQVRRPGPVSPPFAGPPPPPSDGWRLVAGAVPPSVDQVLEKPPRPSFPEAAFLAPWPALGPLWAVLEVGRRVEHPGRPVYGRPDLDPRTAYGADWLTQLSADHLLPGRARRRRGLSLTFLDPQVVMRAGEEPDVRVELRNCAEQAWHNRSPVDHDLDADGVRGRITTPGGKLVALRPPSFVGIGVQPLPDLEFGRGITLRVVFLPTLLQDLPPGEYRIRAELGSLHLAADPIPLIVLPSAPPRA